MFGQEPELAAKYIHMISRCITQSQSQSNSTIYSYIPTHSRLYILEKLAYKTDSPL